MPQQATSLGLKYNAPKYWYAGINFNYFADIYLSPNPDEEHQKPLLVMEMATHTLMKY